MSRTKWKGPYLKKKNRNKIIELTRNSEITLKMVDKTVWVPNGKSLVKLDLNEDMVGHKAGEFVPTRAVFSFKKKKKKNSI